MKRTDLIYHLKQHCETRTEALRLVAEIFPPRTNPMIEEAEDFIIDKLRTGPKRAETLVLWAQKRGIGRRTLYRARRRLFKEVKSSTRGFGPDRVAVWSLNG